MQKYKTLVDRFEYPTGTIVVKTTAYDYGCARDDSIYTGKLHISVSNDLEEGKYPFFTIDVNDLELI